MSLNDFTPLPHLSDQTPPLVEYELSTPSSQSLLPHNSCETPREARSKLDQYLKDFALPHGYKISVGHSTTAQNTVTYVCSRSGRPAKRKDDSKPTKSLKIECPFEMIADYLPLFRSWTLTPIHSTHNHPPESFHRQPVHVVNAGDQKKKKEVTKLASEVTSFLLTSPHPSVITTHRQM